MSARLTEIVVDCVEPERLAEFWCSVLHWTVVDRDGGAVEIGDGDQLPTLLFDTSPDPKTVKNRIHLDVRAEDGNQKAEVERILRLGARTIDIGQGNVSWVVLADPEGNEFCVLQGAP